MSFRRVLLLCLLACLNESFAADDSFVVLNPMAGLTWHVHEVRTDTQNHRVWHLEGEFHRPGWSLLGEKRPITVSPDGKFTLDKSFENGTVSVDLLAVGPNGEVASETVGYFATAASANPPPPPAAPPPPPPTLPPAKWRPFDFQAGLLSDFRGSVWLTNAPKLSWTPRYSLTANCGIRANVGATVMRELGSGYFVALDYVLLYSRNLGSQFQAEVGGGAESWLGYGGTRGLIRGNFAWLLKKEIKGTKVVLDRVLASYSVLTDSGFTQAVFLGAGFTLF